MKNASRFSQPLRNTTSHFGLAMLALLVVLLTGCDSTDAMEESASPLPPAETPEAIPALGIEMSSIEVTLTSGEQGLQFFAQASADVFYKKVTIKPPPPFEEVTYSLGNTFVIQEETIAMQDENSAYLKVGGTWTFTYDVTTGTGANARDETVRVSYSIAGKRASDPSSGSGLLGTVLR